MTMLEKAKELRPDLTEEEIVNGCCPDDSVNATTIRCSSHEEESGRWVVDCHICWNKPYEEGEKK